MVGIERPLKLFCGNKLAIIYPNNNRSNTKSRHVDIKFLVVKEKVQNGQILIEHIGTKSMVPCPLTIGLLPKVFHEHVAHIGVSQFSNSMLQWEFVIEDICSLILICLFSI